MLSGRPYLKRALDNNKGTSDNILTILTSEFPEKQFTVFGSHLKHFPS